MDLRVEVSQRLGQRVLHDDRKRIELLAVEAFLDQAALRLPGFALSREQALAKEVAHPLDLDLRLAVVAGVGLQHMLDHGGVDGDDGFLDAAQVEAEGVSQLGAVLRKNLHGIAGHGA